MTTKTRARRRGRLAALAIVAALVAGACGSSDTPEANSTSTTAPAADHVTITGVPGVSDTEIRYALLGTNSNNPTGICYLECFTDGVEAYFAYRNDQGGIYGRQLTLGTPVDDELGKTLERSIEVISKNDAFGVFDIPILGDGFPQFTKAGWPVYTFLTDHELGAQPNIFGSYAIACILGCPRLDYAYVARTLGVTKIAALSYSYTALSKACADQVEISFDKYKAVTGGATVVYKNSDLVFGFPNGIAPEVTAMKKAGVELIFTCLEENGNRAIAQESLRQGLDAPIVHYAGFDEAPFTANASTSEGHVIGTHLRPFLATPSSGQKLFKQWMGKTGAKELGEVAVHGWIAADLAYQGLEAAGPSFDRQQVIDATNALKGYTADGWIPARELGKNHVAPTPDDPITHGEQPFCFSYLQVHEGKFALMEPATREKPYVCWPGTTYDWSEPVARTF
jgi:hypothetical protein